MPPTRAVLYPVPGEGDLGLVDALAQLTFAVQGALGRIAAAHELSIVQARMLGILRDRRPTIKALAKFLQLDKSSVTGLVDRAQERGLVARTASTIDRRSVHVTITAVGQELVDQAQAAFEAEVAVLVADLTPAQRTRLSRAASLIVAADGRRRGIDIFDAAPASEPVVKSGRLVVVAAVIEAAMAVWQGWMAAWRGLAAPRGIVLRRRRHRRFPVAMGDVTRDDRG